jgi:hypothetical protein
MLALICIYLGDLLWRRFYRFVPLAHRWAAAVITGLLISSPFLVWPSLFFATRLWTDALM